MMATARITGRLPRVAVVGCGRWGRNLVRVFRELGVLAAVCDESEAQLHEVAHHYDVPPSSFEPILSAPEIDGVVVATPAATHAALALQVLEAGKHVFVEKPLALDVADALRVEAAAVARDRILMVGHLLQYHPAFQKLQELVASGALGRLNYLYSNRLNLGQFRREEDVFWSFAPHDISMILTLVGELPDRVEAAGHCYLHGRIADVTTMRLHFANGINAHIFVSWLHPSKEQKLVVIGQNAMAVFDDCQPWSHKLVVYPHRIAWRDGAPAAERADAQRITLDEDEPLQRECRHFIECITATQQPRTDAREAISVLRVLDAGRRSMLSGVPVALVLTSEMRFFAHETASVDGGCTIGAGTRIWRFSHILKGSHIGRDCVIGQNVVIGPDVTVGDRCKIQNNVSLYRGVTLEGGVFCGPSCVFTNVINPRAEIERKHECRPTPVGYGATIGANATILCGNRLGPFCMIGAGAVVTHDIPGHALVIGNPARQVGWVSRSGHRLNDALICPHTGEHYVPDGHGGLMLRQEERKVA